MKLSRLIQLPSATVRAVRLENSLDDPATLQHCLLTGHRFVLLQTQQSYFNQDKGLTL